MITIRKINWTSKIFYDTTANYQIIERIGCGMTRNMCHNLSLKFLNKNKDSFCSLKDEWMKNNFKLETLPPTIAATIQQSLRVYFEIHEWQESKSIRMEIAQPSIIPWFSDDFLTDILVKFSCKCKTEKNVVALPKMYTLMKELSLRIVQKYLENFL